MIFKIPKIVEVDVQKVRIIVSVWYGDEEIPNDFPGRRGDTWNVSIDIDSGKILDWPPGKEWDLHLTVKDGGTYILYDTRGIVVATLENEYVPHGLIPGDYGDVIRLKIRKDGTITNWHQNPNLDDFF